MTSVQTLTPYILGGGMHKVDSYILTDRKITRIMFGISGDLA
jgi:hypothetical protein